MHKKKIHPLGILLILISFSAITGCNPEPELKLLKTQSNQISNIQSQRPIIGDNSFNVSAMLMSDSKN